MTNKRTITTRVLVDDGGMIVLGGLIEDRLTDLGLQHGAGREGTACGAAVDASPAAADFELCGGDPRGTGRLAALHLATRLAVL